MAASAEDIVSNELEENLTVSSNNNSEPAATTIDAEQQQSITEDKAESSNKPLLGSTKQSNGESSSSRLSSSRKEPISYDFLKDMNEKYDGEFIVVKCENDEEVSVPASLAVQSGFLSNALDVGLGDLSMPLPSVPASVLKMIMEYWSMHVGEAGLDEEHRKDLNQWETEFFTRMGPDALYDLLEVANYISARGLLERGADHVADLIKKMNVDEIRAHFGMKNDFTPEEEQQLKKDFPWAYEDI